MGPRTHVKTSSPPLLKGYKMTIDEGIAKILHSPDRDFTEKPLQQEEILAVIETAVNAVNDPNLDEGLAQFYIRVIEFLKTKILYN